MGQAQKDGKWRPREDLAPSPDCFFHEAKRCVGFKKCKDCDFHDLEPTKVHISLRIRKELGKIKENYRELALLKGRMSIDKSVYSDEKRLGMDALDRFNGILIMNRILNDKFGYRIPDISSFTVQRMLKNISKNKERYLKDV
jgi:hypothetical protein